MYSNRLLLENNLMLKALCNRLGVNPETYTIVGTKSKGSQLKAKVAELTKLGYSKSEICNMLACSPSTVANYRKQINLCLLLLL